MAERKSAEAMLGLLAETGRATMMIRPAFRPFLAGLGARLLVAGCVIVALWSGFFWAIAELGPA